MIYIYALTDPDTGLHHYVGQTCDPAQRVIQHRHRLPGGKVGEWVLSLRKEKKKVCLSILEKVPDVEANTKEIEWVETLLKHGHPIGNVSAPGSHSGIRSHKGRQMVALWTDDADLLKELSEATGKTQVQLLHNALQTLAEGTLKGVREEREADAEG